MSDPDHPLDTVASANTPYAGLTPHVVLDALESVGIHCDGRLIGLNSYENRVYQAWRDPDIDRAETQGEGLCGAQRQGDRDRQLERTVHAASPRH